MAKLDKFAQDLYLEIHCAKGFEWQVPEYARARWYHLLWLIVPIVGFLLFDEAIRNA